MLVRNFHVGDFYNSEPCVCALGNFDGVHLGHRALISKTVELAKSRGIKSAVFTFADRPEAVLGKECSPCITETEKKLSLIGALGIDCVFLCGFAEIRNFDPKYFVLEILANQLNVKAAVCGYNFRFGKNGVGTAETLSALMEGNTAVISPVLVRNSPVSSTQIRRAVEAGDLEYAAEMLGRPFFIDFPVVHGKELGRTIGVPTINQNFPAGHIVPAKGVYVCKVKIGENEFPGVANIGIRPTVENTDFVNCETHIIGVSDCLYDKRIKVSLYKKLRDEQKFPSIDKLRKQIKIDIENATNYFGEKND